MKSEDKPKLLQNNIGFFYENIISLINMRPKVEFFIIKASDSSIQLSIKGGSANQVSSDNLMQIQQQIKAINSSVILNCFSLFEASIEWRLLNDLTTEGLSGIQEKIMSKYIDNIIRISNIDNYKSEYKFITGKSIGDLFNEAEKKMFTNIEKFYVLRHLLIHGSAMKMVSIHLSNREFIRLDEDDREYQNLVSLLNLELKLNVSKIHFPIDTLLILNQITDMLFFSTNQVVKKLLHENESKIFKKIKSNGYEQGK